MSGDTSLSTETVSEKFWWTQELENLATELETLVSAKDTLEHELFNKKLAIKSIRSRLANLRKADANTRKRIARGPTQFQKERQTTAVARRKQVLDMRANGMTTGDIADALGIASGTAARLIESAQRFEKQGLL